MSQYHAEPKFVGEGRIAIVKGLVAVFEEVKLDGHPKWIALEGNPGWGKTRLLREFYAALSSKQTGPRYWPSSMFADAGRSHSDVAARRKRVNPGDFNHVPKSLPSYMWWGITCEQGNGTATDSLLASMSILSAHEPFLEHAWRKHVGLIERSVGPVAAALARLGAGESFDAILSAGIIAAAKSVELLADGTIPGFAFLKWGVKTGVRSGVDSAKRQRALAGGGQVHSTQTHIVTQLVELVSRLAIPEMPMVLVVEDVHDADDLLLDFLSRIVASECSVMVITTGWPTRFRPDLESRFVRAGTRFVRIGEGDQILPPPFSAESSMQRLSEADMASIFPAYFSDVEDRTRALLLQRYRVPLELELLLASFQHEFGPEGQLVLTEGQVANLPGSIAALYGLLWSKLPEDVQLGLHLATFVIPSVVSGDPFSGNAWDNELLRAALIQARLIEPNRVIAEPASESDAPAWIRSIARTTREFQFHEPAQVAIALAGASYSQAAQDAIQSAVVVESARRVEMDTRGVSLDAKAAAARLILALDERAPIESHVFKEAVRVLMLRSSERAWEQEEVLRLGRLGMSRGFNPRTRLDREIGTMFYSALRDLGRNEEAEKFREALPPGAVMGVHMAEDWFEAQREYMEELLRTKEPDDPELIDCRNALAVNLAHAGQFDEAIPMIRRLISIEERLYGADTQNLDLSHDLLEWALSGQSEQRAGTYVMLTGYEDDNRTEDLNSIDRDGEEQF